MRHDAGKTLRHSGESWNPAPFVAKPEVAGPRLSPGWRAGFRGASAFAETHALHRSRLHQPRARRLEKKPPSFRRKPEPSGFCDNAPSRRTPAFAGVTSGVSRRVGVCRNPRPSSVTPSSTTHQDVGKNLRRSGESRNPVAFATTPQVAGPRLSPGWRAGFRGASAFAETHALHRSRLHQPRARTLEKNRRRSGESRNPVAFATTPQVAGPRLSPGRRVGLRGASAFAETHAPHRSRLHQPRVRTLEKNLRRSSESRNPVAFATSPQIARPRLSPG